MTIQSELYIYPENAVARIALEGFQTSCDRRNQAIESADIKGLNNELFQLISSFDFEYLFISLTNSESIFYRFKIEGSEFEFRWEVYYDYCPGDEDDIQSILHVYQNESKIGSYFGSTYETLEEIIGTLEGLKKRYDDRPQSVIEVTSYEPDNDNLFYVPVLFIA